MYWIIGISIFFVVVILFLASGYFKAPPNKAYIISGLSKTPKIFIGRAGIRIPFLERLDKINLEAIQIDVKTRSSIPTKDFINVSVDATASVKISQKEGLITTAIQNFLNGDNSSIMTKVNDLLEGNLREIIGTVSLTEMVNDRQMFSQKVQENVVPDLTKLGLEIVNFNVQNFSDDNGVIDNLGIDNVEQIRKKAAIAKSDAQREIAIAEAENAKQANDAKVLAAEEIAKRNNDLAIKQAELKKEVDTKQAEADAAMEIEAENQRKQHEIATANANLARQEKEIELKAREVEIKEKALEAEIKKTAEAQKFAEQQKADAKLYATQKAAEADLFERQRQAEASIIEAEKKAAADLALAEADAKAKKVLAEAIEAEGKAQAAAAQARGLAEAEAIRAKAKAEAKGMMEKAAALKEYGDAARQQMELDAVKVLYEQLPAIAEAIGKGYAGADIHLIGSDSGQLAGNMMGNITQIIEGFKGATGVDPMSVLSGMLGAKLADTDNV